MPRYKPVYLYILLCLVVFFITLAKIRDAEFLGDFWEHAAVVKELKQNPLHPSHPIISSSQSHVFYSPYSLLVAITAKITGLNPFRALQLFGLGNMCFLLFGLGFFCRVFFKQNGYSVASAALVLMMLFWGREPLFWSGFYHLMGLYLVIPYPSSFALAFSLCLIAYSANRLLNYRTVSLVALGSAVVFISHPTTAIFLFCTLFCVQALYHPFEWKNLLMYFIVVVLTFILVWCWPYFNPIRMFGENNAVFNDQSYPLYLDLKWRYWPIAFALPGLILIRKSKALLFLYGTIFVLLMVFSVGYLLQIFSMGRLISAILLMSHIAIACCFIEAVLAREKPLFFAYSILLAMAFTYSVSANRSAINYHLDLTRQVNTDYYKRLLFMNELVKDNETVLADMENSWYLPSIAGKVFASMHPLHGVTDETERTNQVNLFFGSSVNDSLRNTILQKWKPDFILLDSLRSIPQASTYPFLIQQAQSTVRQNGLILLKLR